MKKENAKYSQNKDLVVFIHGLARTHRSFNKMMRFFSNNDYHVLNTKYPSRKFCIETLSEITLHKILEDFHKNNSLKKIHFITHSMGGILLRYHLAHHKIKNLGRVVMLAPPNHGSEIVDRLKKIPGFNFINGPAGKQLGTNKNSILKMLPKANYELGIIAGTKCINPIYKRIIGQENDGKVSTKSTKLIGMSDFITVPYSHTFLMNKLIVLQQTLHFLKNGHFKK